MPAGVRQERILVAWERFCKYFLSDYYVIENVSGGHFKAGKDR